MKAAAAGRIDGAGHIARQDDALTSALQLRIGNRHGGKQRLGVGMKGILVQLIAVGQFNGVTTVADENRRVAPSLEQVLPTRGRSTGQPAPGPPRSIDVTTLDSWMRTPDDSAARARPSV